MEKKTTPESVVREVRRKMRRKFTSEEKIRIVLEGLRGEESIAEICRREGLYSTDLARIRQQVQEGALERLKARPGAVKKGVAQEDYEALRKELEEKERVLAE